jgi:hypothetical protein
MKAYQIRKFAMLRRVQQFMDDYAASLAGVNASAVRKELDQLVAEMGLNESIQAWSTLDAKGKTALQESLRRALVKHHMRPVATIAAAHLYDVPNFEALRPRTKGVKVAILVQDAMAMAEAARPYQQLFVEYGRPDDFADALVAAAQAVRDAIDDRGKCIMNRAGARGGLKANASRAHVVLRMLDAQVQSALEDDSNALAGWRSVKRIGRGRVVPRAEG